VIASAITIGAVVLPYVAFGDVAGLEILHPAAVVILGGVVTSTVLALFVIPALYLRFAATITAPIPATTPRLFSEAAE
jgi:Cu/Ag efflux pump CusA